MLVEKGADVNARNNDGRTPLLWATKNNNTELSVLLVEKGADVNARNNDGRTPLLWATEKNNTELSVLLVEKGASIWVPLFKHVEGRNINAASSLLYAAVAANKVVLMSISVAVAAAIYYSSTIVFSIS